jgi:hypothetical protein
VQAAPLPDCGRRTRRWFPSSPANMKSKMRKLKVGEWVQVRSKEEILSTLDSKGQLDGMPFMPEMFAFCGKKFQVYKRAHKTCDTVFPIRGRRVDQAVHLDTRCDGSSHGGCQAGCLIFWKLAWLKPHREATLEGRSDVEDDNASEAQSGSRCTEFNVLAQTQSANPNGGEPTYHCQATRLPYATTDLAWWDIRQYFEDYWSGNVSLWQIVCGGVYSLYYALGHSGIGLGRPMQWFYDKFHPLWRGTLFPRKTGTIPEGKPTPAETLDLRPGELVRVKPYTEILKTLNTSNQNRGLYWDAEEVVYCDGTYRVLKSVTKIIDEKTGKMQEMKTPCIVLESAVCQSRYSECRMFCPRSIYAYFREIWLERVETGKPSFEGTEDKLLKTHLMSMETLGSPKSGSQLQPVDTPQISKGTV